MYGARCMGCIALTSIARSDVLMEDESKKAPRQMRGAFLRVQMHRRRKLTHTTRLTGLEQNHNKALCRNIRSRLASSSARCQRSFHNYLQETCAIINRARRLKIALRFVRCGKAINDRKVDRGILPSFCTPDQVLSTHRPRPFIWRQCASRSRTIAEYSERPKAPPSGSDLILLTKTSNE